MKPKKRKKQQCIHCSEIINYNYIKRHSENCLVYTKLIINGVQCSICSKVFGTRRNVNQHIGHHHKELCHEIRQKMNLDFPTKTSAKAGSEISTEQNASIQDNQTPICPGIAVNETLAKPGSGISKGQNSGIPCPVILRKEDSNHPKVPIPQTNEQNKIAAGVACLKSLMVPLLHTAETLAKPGLGISKGQNPGIQNNQVSPCPKIPGWEHFNHANVPRSQDNAPDKIATGITCKSCKSRLVPLNYKAKTSPKPALQISTGQSPGIHENLNSLCPVILGQEKSAYGSVPTPKVKNFLEKNPLGIHGNQNSPCPVIPGQEKPAYGSGAPGSVPRPKVNNSLEKINYIKVA